MKKGLTRRSMNMLLGTAPALALGPGSNDAVNMGFGAKVNEWAGAPTPVSEPGPNMIMDYRKALQKVLMDPEMRSLQESEYYWRHRHVGYIDPDIQVLRSLSPMAKVVYQRQRNVIRAMEEELSPPGDVFKAFRERIHKLMWG